MNDILRLTFALLISVVMIKILMNVINLVGIDFVGFFEEVWTKIKKTK